MADSSATHHQPFSILLIDDQPLIAEILNRILKDHPNISLFYCQNPAEALEFALRMMPSLILVDITMSPVDGLDLVKLFKSTPALSYTPAIILSAQDDPQVKVKAFASGADDYIVKLPDSAELIARFRHHVEWYAHLKERNEAYSKIEEKQRHLNLELAEGATYVRSLLPKPLTNGLIHINWRFIPSKQLGGDAFGYHWLDNRYFALYLLDVCGHGLGASLLAISVVNLLRSETVPNVDLKDPRSLLSALNEAFQMEKHNNMFFTIWYGVYDSLKNEIIYSTAGHPSGLLIHSRNLDIPQVVGLKTEGVVIGAIPNVPFFNATVHIEPHSKLYLFTDGIYEIMKKDGGIWGMLAFSTLLAKQSLDSHSTLDTLITQIQEIQGKREFMDDVSILEIFWDLPTV